MNELTCTDPATGAHLGTVSVFTPEQVRERVEKARVAQRTWSTTSFRTRRQLLGRIQKHILAHADELCDVISRDSGKTRENALLGEIWPVCEKLRWTAAHGERYLRPERVPSGLLLHKKATIEYHPLGVVGVICPWNFPLQNVLGPAIPALMAGNAVVIKVSEWTSWSAARLARIFADAGDLVQIITGAGETGEALIDAGVDKIIFTGSPGNGRKVLARAAQTLTPCILELGGKDPMIVCEDAHLERAVHAALAGVMIASGQMCVAAERIYVMAGIYDRFVEAVVRLTGALRQGPPLSGRTVDVGALTSPHQADRVERLVADAVSRGARVRVGGKRHGQFFEPTVLTDVDHSMDIMREETFGPVMCIQRVTSDEEAVRLANDTSYGLSSSVFSRDATRASRLAAAVRAGSVVINDFGLVYMVPELPFGGVGGSGFGRLNGREGLRACTNIKAVVSDRFSLSFASKVFPVKATDFAMFRSLLRLLYGGRI